MAASGNADREFAQLLRSFADAQMSESEFSAEYWSYMEVPLGEAAIQVFDYMIDDMNIAEHLGLIVDEQYRWRLRGSARLIELGASAGEVKQFFKQKWPGA